MLCTHTSMALDAVIASNGATDCEGTLSSEGFNAVSITSNCTLQPVSSGVHDLLNVDAKLGEVAKQCSRRDQLGNRRTDGNNDGIIRCDIGAVELGSH